MPSASRDQLPLASRDPLTRLPQRRAGPYSWPVTPFLSWLPASWLPYLAVFFAWPAALLLLVASCALPHLASYIILQMASCPQRLKAAKWCCTHGKIFDSRMLRFTLVPLCPLHGRKYRKQTTLSWVPALPVLEPQEPPLPRGIRHVSGRGPAEHIMNFSQPKSNTSTREQTLNPRCHRCHQ